MSHSTVVAMAACAAAVCASSFGAVVVETELNGTAMNNGTGTAQFLDQSAFTVGLGGEIDGMLPTASLRGRTGADDVDFFRFTTLGGAAHFDIDRTAPGVDTSLALFRWDGTLIAECDDASGDAGSEGDWDAFIGDVSLEAGIYFIAVSMSGNSPSASFTGTMFTELTRPDGGYGGFLLADADMGDSSYLRSGEQEGQAYTLHVSIPSPSVLGVAAAGGLVLGRRRRQEASGRGAASGLSRSRVRVHAGGITLFKRKQHMRSNLRVVSLLIAAGTVLAASSTALASSHGEAPFIKGNPRVDATDFYMFNSYESGREGYVTIIANYYPLQDPYGGPNYFTLDPDAVYQIHIDSNGDAREDLTFSFKMRVQNNDLAINVGGVPVAVPLVAVGQVGGTRDATAALNVVETYGLSVIRGDRFTGRSAAVTDAATGSSTFKKPVDYIGTKTLPNYESYAADHIYNVRLPGSKDVGRVFVGQRKDPFVVNLGETFDLVNNNPLGPENGRLDKLEDKNVTSFILEIPASYLVNAKTPDTVIGGWTTASLPRGRVYSSTPTFNKPTTTSGTYVQVSRLSMPLVNEVVIGLRDKNKFNASEPRSDAQFGAYVTNPTLPTILASLFPVAAPCTPRNDLVQVFLTGVPGLNEPAGVQASEMLRLNTNIDPAAGGIPAKPRGMQHRMGVLGGDLAGYPNGRRPGDDVVDISLRAVMGALLPPECAPNGALPYTDGAFIDDSFFDAQFPYIRTPIPGAGI